jgi:hypothetical protein
MEDAARKPEVEETKEEKKLTAGMKDLMIKVWKPVIVVVAAAAAIGAGYWYFFKREDESEEA